MRVSSPLTDDDVRKWKIARALPTRVAYIASACMGEAIDSYLDDLQDETPLLPAPTSMLVLDCLRSRSQLGSPASTRHWIMRSHRDKSAWDILGSPDNWKFKSCLTLFEMAAADDGDRELFQAAIDQFYSGKRDEKTLLLVGLPKSATRMLVGQTPHPLTPSRIRRTSRSSR